MKKANEISIFWFRRDLRLSDNAGLYHALKSGLRVLPIFIFDEEILDELPKNDARVNFIYDELRKIHLKLRGYDSSLMIKKGKVMDVWSQLLASYSIKNVFYNKDYEPYGRSRDQELSTLFKEKGVSVGAYKDHVIFEEHEIVKQDQTPYTVYTPYKNKWRHCLQTTHYQSFNLDASLLSKFDTLELLFPSLEKLGFYKSKQQVLPYTLKTLSTYEKYRDFPFQNSTSYLSPHLRFGTVSIRELVATAIDRNEIFLNELIWREFFMQILVHFPHVVNENFRAKYNGIQWRNRPEEFEKWKNGVTGYPLVDAGMRQLNETGYMHNRVRMVTASFLVKHLLIDWRWGEAYFAEKLLDYELSSNNGNWQWSAGTGCDAAPYFRIFNPTTQLKKFDSTLNYVKKWIPELTANYPQEMVDHAMARKRCLAAYKVGIERSTP